jgi:hypothetical protein
MADGVDSSVQLVELAALDPGVDRATPQARCEQLPPRHNPMLTLSQGSDAEVGPR